MQFVHSMSTDVHLRIYLFCLFTAHTWAGPLSTPSPAFLTPFLANKVPICAQPCLESFVADSFPPSVCSSPSINCLCTSDSETGYTIGEGALSCLASDCRDWDEDEAISAYDVCSNIDGSLPNTHTILTATHTSSTTVSGSPPAATTASGTSYQSTTSTPSRRSSLSSPSAASTSTPSFNGMTTTASFSSSSTTQTPASSMAALPGSTQPSPAPTPVLTKPQVAGVVVASIGASALAFGLCFLLFCCRRRKHVRRHSGSSFGGDKVVGSTTDSTPDLAIIAARDFGHDPEGKEVVPPNRKQSPPQVTVMTPASTGEGGWSQWRRNTAPQDIGLALAPGVFTQGHPSPKTPASHRTRNSQLLPEKPSYSLFPPPLRPSPQSRRVSQSLEAQLAARNASTAESSLPQVTGPRFPSTLDTSQSTMQGDSSSRSPVPRLNIFPFMQAARAESGHKPYRQELPSDMISGPQWSAPTDSLIRKPLPAHASPSARGIRLGRSIHNKDAGTLRDRLARKSTVLKPLDTSSSSTSRREKSDSRPPTWFSTGSETSFEDAEDDAADPISALTPVKERHNSDKTDSVFPNSLSSLRPNPLSRGDSLLARRREDQEATMAAENMTPLSVLNIVRHSAKQQILQSPILSEPLGTDSSSLDSPRTNRIGAMTPPPRIKKGAGMTPPPSGWPGRR